MDPSSERQSMADGDGPQSAPKRVTPPAASTPPQGAQQPQSGPQGARDGGAENGAVPPTVLDKLRERRDEISENRRLDLEVAGYGGALVARYRPLPYREYRQQRKQTAKRGDDEATAELRIACATLARACEAIAVRV